MFRWALERVYGIVVLQKGKGKYPERSKKMAVVINKTTEKELLKIAKRYSATVEQRGDLKVRDNDGEDFIDVSVWGLEQMLQQAYKLGREAK